MITSEARTKMGWKRDLVFTKYTKKCEICGKEFTTVPSSSKQHTCSIECSSKKKEVEKKKIYCKICNKEIIARKSQHKVYCSTECKIVGLAQLKIKKFENKRIYGKWKNSKELKKYLLEKYNNTCQECGWNKNPNVLETHHIDRNRKNNKEENVLLWCPNCHSIEHYNKQDGQFKNNFGREK
jgi:endogenous inhibitor of DNA gyrase (YacG/DUF329 family)